MARTPGLADASSRTWPALGVMGLVFAVLAGGIVTAGVRYYRHYEQQYRAEVERQITAIAELKAAELADWRKERLGDASVFYKNAAFSALVRRYFDNPADAEARAHLQTWLGLVQAHLLYDRVFLLDTQGVERISAPDASEPVCPHVAAEDVSETLRLGRVNFPDFHRHPDQPIRLTVLVPILDDRDGSRPLGVLVLRIDPETYLYPYIQHWPTPSRTAETLLVRRDGNDALFLNDLRFRKDAALHLRVPLEGGKDLPAVKAAMGQEGIVEGVDYRGVPVIAAVRAVPDSPWFLVARMDTSEVYAPLRERLWVMVALVGALLLVTGAVMGLVWRRQRLRWYRERSEASEALRESEARLSALFGASPAGILVADIETRRFHLANPTICRMLGYSHDELMRLGMEDIHRKEDLPGVISAFEAQMRGETPLAPGLPCLRKDGSVFYADINSSSVVVDGRESLVGFFTDVTERRRAAEEIRRLNRQIEFILAGTKTGLDIIDAEFNITYIDPEWQKVYGPPQGRKCYEYFMGRSEVCPDCGIVKALETKEIVVTEEVLPKENNRPVQVTTMPFQDERGKWLVAEIHVDITERKAAEAARARLAAIVETTPDFVGFADAKDTHIVYINRAGRRMVGIGDDEDVTKLRIADVHPDRTNQLLSEVVLPAAAREGVWTGECAFLNRDGREIPVLMVLQAHRGAGGEIEVFSTISRDITERRRIEEALRRSENLNRNLVEHLPQRIFIKDRHSVYVSCNTNYARDLGIEPEQIVGKDDFAFYPRELAEAYRADDQAVTTSGTSKDIEEAYLVSGEERWVHTIKVPYHDEQGQVVGVLGVFEDVTLRKKAEETLRRYASDLEQANKEVKQFAYIVSHDLRAPLVSLKGFAAELRSSLAALAPVLEAAVPRMGAEEGQAAAAALHTDIPEALGFIDSSATRMDCFISALLKLSRLGGSELHFEPVSLAEVVEAALAGLAHQMGARQAEVSVGPLPEVVADRTAVEQIVGNILANAVNYLEPGRPGRIEISATRGDRETTFVVRDNGRGIAPEDMPKVFAPFRRAGRQDVPGEGMGMAYVQTLVRRHGGQIRCESQLGVGTTFTVTFPNPPLEEARDVARE